MNWNIKFYPDYEQEKKRAINKICKIVREGNFDRTILFKYKHMDFPIEFVDRTNLMRSLLRKIARTDPNHHDLERIILELL